MRTKRDSPGAWQIAILLAASGAAPCCGQALDADPPVRPAADDMTPRMDVLTEAQWNRIDRAIERALERLARQQSPDGSFPTDPMGTSGVTSLCVLAMLSSHYLPDEGKYGRAISRAVDYLVSVQKPNGLLSTAGPSGRVNYQAGLTNTAVAANYNHAISTLALAEVFAMTGDRRSADVAQAIEQALRFSLRAQLRQNIRPTDRGGWRYLAKDTTMDSDLSITGWYLMSLRSAKNAGFDVPEEAIDLAVGYVTRCFNRNEGVFFYGQRPSRLHSRGMAAAGILALAHAGKHHSPMARSAGDWILKYPHRQYNELRFEKDSFHYGAFYCCQATYQLGGRYWEEYFPTTAMLLVDNQHPDGSWSSDAESNESRYGSTYTTALAVLALSAPNQVLPVFQR